MKTHQEYFSEWLCIRGQQESSLEYLGRMVYRGYRQKKVHDDPSLELCRGIDDIFAKAKYEGTVKATENIATDYDQTQKQLSTGDRLVAFANSALDNLGAKERKERFYKELKTYAKALGRRAAEQNDLNPVIPDSKARYLALLINKLKKDGDEIWDRMVIAEQSSNVLKNLFHSMRNVFYSFGSFLMETRFRPMVEKMTEYQPKEELGKLKERYQSIGADKLLSLVDSASESMQNYDMSSDLENMFLNSGQAEEEKPQQELSLTVKKPSTPQ